MRKLHSFTGFQNTKEYEKFEGTFIEYAFTPQGKFHSSSSFDLISRPVLEASK